jgi:hypothetical protein
MSMEANINGGVRGREDRPWVLGSLIGEEVEL